MTLVDEINAKQPRPSAKVETVDGGYPVIALHFPVAHGPAKVVFMTTRAVDEFIDDIKKAAAKIEAMKTPPTKQLYLFLIKNEGRGGDTYAARTAVDALHALADVEYYLAGTPDAAPLVLGENAHLILSNEEMDRVSDDIVWLDEEIDA